MTNIFSVTIEHEKKPYVFCVSDSQITGGNTKEGYTQKLIQKGDNLIMWAGLYEIALQVYNKLNPNLSPQEAAEQILNITEPYSHRANPSECATFFVAGKGKEGIEKYEIHTTNLNTPHAQQTRGIVPVTARIYSGGSGSAQVNPAINRDTEKGHLLPAQTPLQALTLCFGVGLKADSSLTVNEKLQIGVVSPEMIRTILPPGVQPSADFSAYIKNITGIEVNIDEKDFYEKNKEMLRTMSKTVNGFYHALESQMSALNWADIESNGKHSALKEGQTTKKEYMAYLEKRIVEAEKTQPLVDAFMAGGLQNLVNAARPYYADLEGHFKDAEELTK